MVRSFLASYEWRSINLRLHFTGRTAIKEHRIASNRNTYAKRQREQEKRQRADDKRVKRAKKTSGVAETPRVEDVSQADSDQPTTSN